MKAVLDASAFVGMLDGTVAMIEPWEYHAPDFIDIEVVSALRKRVWRGGRPASAAREDPEYLARMHIDRHRSSRHAARAWELRENIAPFDAVYVALAQGLGAPLITLDLRLARAAEPYCDVIVPATVEP